MHRTAIVIAPLSIITVGVVAVLGGAGSTRHQRAAPGAMARPAVASEAPAAMASEASSSSAPAAQATAASAAPPVVAPADLDEVADAAPYVYRQLHTGRLFRPARHTWVLRRAGKQASLRLTVEIERRVGASIWTIEWQHRRTRTFVGTASRRGERTVLHLTSAGGEQLDLTCVPQRLAIHRPGARLVPAPKSGGEECDPRAVWRPAATYTVDVLACSAPENTDWDDSGLEDLGGAPPVFGWPLLLAPDPGVESVNFDSDCAAQGSGLRRAQR